ncbi:MAG: glutamate--tRNA ligase [Planctomycetota bacterium]|nr:glutamate--tRNA ligase [Planctomycetota bacterium]
MNKTIKVRIAPSPTGDPHVGTAYVALFNLAFARRHGGKFILRIEDTDRARSTVDSEKMIYDSLRWLNLQWDEGPDIGGPNGPYRQSERSELYRKHAEQLMASGAAYRCFCTPARLDELRKKLQASGASQRHYDGLCRNLSESEARAKSEGGAASVVRLKVPSEGETGYTDFVRGDVSFQNTLLDDQVLLKSDGFPTYHLANVVDDHLMGVTHVMRAEEWISSTPKHLLLYSAFGWEPPRFAHLPLLRNSDKSKISKRKNPTSLKWYEEQGYLPEALLNFLALMGFSMPDGVDIFGFDKLVEHFDFSRINTTGPVFDLEKLNWLNGEYIRKLKADELVNRLSAHMGRFGGKVDLLSALSPATRATVSGLFAPRIARLAEFPEMAAFIFTDALTYDHSLLVPKKCSRELIAAGLREAEKVFESPDALADHKRAEDRLREIAGAVGLKAGDFFMALRVAVTGRTASPPLLDTMAVLGAEKTRNRIAAAVQALGRA